jgi:KDO2-lipid IV(A) lauroyltransferase
MQLIVFLLIYPFIWIISILPFRLLYIFSDFLSFLAYRVIRYRLRVVRQNLDLVFPNLSKKERIKIESKFYQHFFDMFLEMMKTMTISEKEIKNRFTFTNLEHYIAVEKKGKSIAMLASHMASYEWLVSISYHVSFPSFLIYKPVSNKYFEKLVKKIRSRFNAHLVPHKETFNVIEDNIKNNVLGLFGFASDQSPQYKVSNHWFPFFGHEVPIYTGAESVAKKYDFNVMFVDVKKPKRGHYVATFETVSLDPKSVKDFEISEWFIKRVEQQIKETPEYYLWTHKRFKHLGKPKLTA